MAGEDAQEPGNGPKPDVNASSRIVNICITSSQILEPTLLRGRDQG